MVKTPHSLPTGHIILQTATIKNDLQSLANFTMLLGSLESYPALKKSTDSPSVSTLKLTWNLMTTRAEIYYTIKVNLTSPISPILFDFISCFLQPVSYISFFVLLTFLLLNMPLDLCLFSSFPNIDEPL